MQKLLKRPRHKIEKITKTILMMVQNEWLQYIKKQENMNLCAFIITFNDQFILKWAKLMEKKNCQFN